MTEISENELQENFLLAIQTAVTNPSPAQPNQKRNMSVMFFTLRYFTIKNKTTLVSGLLYYFKTLFS